MHIVRGLRQALVLVVALAAFALLAAGIWWAFGGGGVRPKVGIALLVLGGLVAISGNGMISRSGTAEINALQGRAPDGTEPGEAGSLTSFGIFLFVALPLFLAGGALYGTG